MKVKGAPKPWDITDCSEGLRREKDFSALGAVKLTQAWNEHHHVVLNATKLYCKKTFVNTQGEILEHHHSARTGAPNLFI